MSTLTRLVCVQQLGDRITNEPLQQSELKAAGGRGKLPDKTPPLTESTSVQGLDFRRRSGRAPKSASAAKRTIASRSEEAGWKRNAADRCGQIAREIFTGKKWALFFPVFLDGWSNGVRRVANGSLQGPISAFSCSAREVLACVASGQRHANSERTSLDFSVSSRVPKLHRTVGRPQLRFALPSRRGPHDDCLGFRGSSACSKRSEGRRLDLRSGRSASFPACLEGAALPPTEERNRDSPACLRTESTGIGQLKGNTHPENRKKKTRRGAGRERENVLDGGKKEGRQRWVRCGKELCHVQGGPQKAF